MALVNQPPILASSFAVNGDKNTIPTTNSGTEGLASLSLGFPPITQQPVSQGGIPPQRADFNGIFNLITNFLMFIQNGSIFAYSSSLDYQPPAIVYGNNALYRCIATNGANTSAGVQPLSNTSYWQPLIPVGGITVSGNTITVTNETGTQIQYTIDTITNPPSQSDSSNKIVTSAWVKAYAPSKTGTGASGTWNITANKAIADKNGLQIDTGYLKLTGGAMNGNIITQTSGNLRIKNGGDNTTDGVGILLNDNGGINIFDWTENEFIISYQAGNIYATTNTPQTSDNSNNIATTSFVNNYAPSKSGNGATGTWGINITGNAVTATKATQDSQGQQINTTYVKSVTSSNATLTITKGNGTTSTTTINNVAHSTNADTATKATQDGNGNTISSTYLKLTGGAMNGNITNQTSGTIRIKNGGDNTTDGAGILLNDDGFRVYDWNLSKDIISYASGDTYATTNTPPNTDNSTKIATTAFVKSLFTASKTSNGWWKDGNTGIIYQWCKPSSQGNNNFPISFPNQCFYAFATNTSQQGNNVDNSFAYVVNNSTYYYATKSSDNQGVNFYPGAVWAVGY